MGRSGYNKRSLKPVPSASSTLALTVNYSPAQIQNQPDSKGITSSSTSWWAKYWYTGALIDLTSTPSPNTNATELQRRIILSQYLLAINSAGHDPPQESGLVNNGRYGKFHMEMVLWHLAHWSLRGKWDLLNRSIPGIYSRFLPSSLERAQEQGYQGARW